MCLERAKERDMAASAAVAAGGGGDGEERKRRWEVLFRVRERGMRGTSTGRSGAGVPRRHGPDCHRHGTVRVVPRSDPTGQTRVWVLQPTVQTIVPSPKPRLVPSTGSARERVSTEPTRPPELPLQ